MKKIMLGFAVILFATTTRLAAQNTVGTTPETGKDKNNKEIQIESFSWGATSATGAQTVVVPGGKGTLKFEKNGDRFTNVMYFDAAGKSYRLQTTPAGTGGAPNPSCKFPLPDACFGTADKNIGMCICKPTDLAGNTGGEYSINLLLPAVQKVREAAAR